MNNFMNKVNRILVQKDISRYPELYYKKSTSPDLSYNITIASSALFYDTTRESGDINWKLI